MYSSIYEHLKYHPNIGLQPSLEESNENKIDMWMLILGCDFKDVTLSIFAGNCWTFQGLFQSITPKTYSNQNIKCITNTPR